MVFFSKMVFAMCSSTRTTPARSETSALPSAIHVSAWTNIAEPFTEKFTEGPCALKIGDDWLIYFDAYQEKIYGTVKMRDFKTFTNITKEVSFPEGHKHGTALKVPREILDGLLHNKP